jgi:tetratricopeptide (TPR) repeat protein
MVSAESWERLFETGNLAIARGLHETAIAEYTRALTVAENTSDYFAQAETLRALAKTYLETNKISEAKQSISKAKDLDVSFWGPDNQHVAEDTFILGETLRREGDFLSARDLYNQVLTIRTTLFGDTHEETLNVFLRLIWTGLEEGRYEELVKVTDHAAKVFRDLHPAGMFGRWLNLQALLQPYLAQKRYIEAELICERTIGILRAILGDRNLELSEILNDCSEIMKQANKHLSSWSLKSRSEAMNDVYSLERQADSLVHQGEFQQAEQLLRRLLANLRKRTAPDKTLVSNALKQYANVLFKQGRCTDAEILQRQAHDWEDKYTTSKQATNAGSSPLFWF